MDEGLLTVEQAAEHLQMHPDTVRRLLREGSLPGVKLGKRQWRISAAALRKHMEGGKAPAAPAAAEQAEGRTGKGE